MPNPSKILGHTWNKENDTLELPAKFFTQEQPVTKRTILSYLGTMYDPLGIISPTMAEGKHIYQEACDEKKSWNGEVSTHEAFESVIMDVERNLNNGPLTNVEAEGGEEEVLTPNMILWGRDVYRIPLVDTEGTDAEKLIRMRKRLEDDKAHAWNRWKREYIHSL